MDEKWRDCEEFWERLRWARSQTSFQRPTDAARSMGIRPGTYRTYEAPKEDGGRAAPVSVIQTIAEKYKVNWVWLMSGRERPDQPSPSVAEWAQVLGKHIDHIPPEKRDDAVRAAEGVLQSFVRKAG